jgi:large subunit ribosomal protein L31
LRIQGGHIHHPTDKDLEMKADIHPSYNEVKVTCSCGSVFTTRSTMSKSEYHVEVCSECHPFYTGKQKIVDTAGRVERFRQKYGNLQRLG